MKKNFLENWRGSVSYGKQNQWRQAQGSSLEERELEVLNAGGVVMHPKDKNTTKVFARDEDGNLWSVIVRNVHLASLENELKSVGYKLAA